MAHHLEHQQQNLPLDQSIIADVSLSLEHPLSVIIINKHFTVGSKEEFLYRRLAIQAAVQRLLQQSTSVRSGKGRKRKLKAVEQNGE